MRIISSGTGFLAVQGVQGPRGPVQVAGWGRSRLAAMSACVDMALPIGCEVPR